MPLNIPDGLPAIEVLRGENIFCLESSQASHQDIRAIRVLLLNLMPKKIETEIHLLRMLSNSPLQVDVELLRITDKPSKNTPIEHMENFYKSFSDIKDKKYDGMIITGAPLGQVPFDNVSFWDDMKEIMDWTVTNVTSVMFLCWAVQAAMYHLYGVDKLILPKKISGVYPHRLVNPLSPIVRGFDDRFDAPHSRYAEVPASALAGLDDLEVVSDSEIAGPYIWSHKDGRHLFVTGHSEYEPNCLRDEYQRDLEAGIDPEVPENYFPDDDPKKEPIVTWKSHGNLLFNNWLNYYVYQLTPFNMNDIGHVRNDLSLSIAE
ncbi:MAG: homoserine O-succinyltransferase [Pseudomonadales bacterium]|nr:homoserine O-succinyltransferase [Pseudomonadales bacterium]MBO6566229.1 homoserine O-succinyltransferase [Pseudomonadales bacterium]MBO6595203.1 homoserine O-succinyltransferase [Pseudomonadales bacterium]MBO6656236.1 homoserine O-succinyltransferase [Pseudomonadales bacterium]MBO6701711.1 homoserine O-succinyltransferase [Pseudomonadales bacterium]